MKLLEELSKVIPLTMKQTALELQQQIIGSEIGDDVNVTLTTMTVREAFKDANFNDFNLKPIFDDKCIVMTIVEKSVLERQAELDKEPSAARLVGANGCKVIFCPDRVYRSSNLYDHRRYVEVHFLGMERITKSIVELFAKI